MIVNERSGAVIASEQRLLTSRFMHAFGLMFRRRLVDAGWVFLFRKTASWPLTNVFVFQRIDALWLDANKQVLQVRTIAPFALHVPGVAGTHFVIELPAGAARRAGVRVGDTVSWEEKGI